MSAFKSNVGIDFVDFLIQAGVTLALMALVGVTDGPEGLYPTIAAGSFVVLGIRRHNARRRQGAPALSSGEMQAERLAELEARVSDLEVGQARMYELEERVDFAERLLVSERNSGAIAPPQHRGTDG